VESCGVLEESVTGCFDSDVAQQFFAEVNKPGQALYER